jgi:hypothetical protein
MNVANAASQERQLNDAHIKLESRLIALGVGQSLARQFAERRRYSDTRLDELRRRLRGQIHLGKFPHLAIYAAGSYARGEASQYSDLDLFFLHDDLDTAPVDDPKLKGIRAVATVIREMEEGMDFPAPSNDGQFLNIARLSDILDHLGGAEDDYKNHFTARMLLILESSAVYGDNSYESALKKIIHSYWRDYEDHAENFRPTFLVNDILRFWRTLCLNYEHRRNQKDESTKTKQKIRNFKLGFSRMATCFATVSLLASYNNVDESDVLRMAKMPPLERLLELGERQPRIKSTLVRAIELYGWFLEKTALPTEKLFAYFEQKSGRIEAFGKVDAFGEAMYELLHITATEQKTLRYLVI